MLKVFFLKRFRKFSLILLVPTVLLFVFIGVQAGRMEKQKMLTTGQQTLDQINDTLDYSIYNAIHQQDIMMSDFSYYLALKKLLNNEHLDMKNLIFMRALKTLLMSYEHSDSYIESLYIYINSCKRFVTSSNNELAVGTNFYDYSWIEEYMKNQFPENNMISRRKIQEFTFEQPVEILTIYQKLEYQRGVIALNIDLKEYKQKINKTLAYKEQIFCLCDTLGSLFFCNNEKLENNEEFIINTIPHIIENQQLNSNRSTGKQWVTISGRTYLLNLRKSKYFNTYLISLLPRKIYVTEMLSFAGWAVLLILADIFVIVILSWITTKRIFYYFNECIDVFAAAEKGEYIKMKESVVKDEYSLVLNNIINMYLKHNQMQLEIIEKQYEAEVAEMRVLQLQINPHFLFNTLQTMDIEIIKDIGPNSKPHIILQSFASIIKYIFRNPLDKVTISEELNYLKEYFSIQQIRFEKRIITYYEVDDDVLDYNIFRLIFQPMVENSFLHGLKDKEHIVIKIKIVKRDFFVQFTVIDNGCGMNKKHLMEVRENINKSDNKNIGLLNVNHRLILNYGKDSRLRIWSKEGMGTAIMFTIPVSKLDARLDSK